MDFDLWNEFVDKVVHALSIVLNSFYDDFPKASWKLLPHGVDKSAFFYEHVGQE